MVADAAAFEDVRKLVRDGPVTRRLRPASRVEGWRRLYIGSATDVEIDGASRVLIPPELRKWAGLDRDVKFMGVGAYFELWDSARYEEREAAMLAGERPEKLRNFVIR
jgi:MraZ protein